MSVNIAKHKFVVVVSKADDVNFFGFISVTSGLNFIEQQVMDEDKALTLIVDALSEDGADLSDGNYSIIDIQSYVDIYGDDEDEYTEE